MKSSVPEEFLGFVRERTPELFQEAYRLTGRQYPAERLLQRALERLVPRWQRIDDPFEYAVRELHRLRLPWWRRWRGGDPPAADTGAGTAPGTGRPVDVGELSLAGARRRRLVRFGAVAGAVVVIGGAIAIVPGWLDADPADPADRSDRANPANPAGPVDLTGKSVVTSFRHEGLQVLNPETGQYEFRLHADGQSSPDLRWTAWLAAGALVLRSTVDDRELRVEALPEALSLAWSPDSSRVLLTAPPPPPPYPDFPQYADELEQWHQGEGAGFREIALVEVPSGDVTVLELAFPDGRAGWFDPAVGAFWAGPDRLAIPTMDASWWLPDQHVSAHFGIEAVAAVVVAISIFDLHGELVDEIPIDTSELAGSEAHAGLAWLPTGLARGAEQLLVRRPGPDQLELAVVDLSAETGPYHGVVIDAPSASTPGPSGLWIPPWPYAWLADGRVLVERLDPWQEGGGFVAGAGQHTFVVDLATGSWQEVEVLAAEFAGETGIPPGAGYLFFSDAAALAPPAAHLAF